MAAVRTFATFEPEPGLRFNKTYHVYNQRFHREDFEEDEKFDATVLDASTLNLPPLARKYPWGLRRLGRLKLYTNRGVGTIFPVRFNCPPDVTLLTLRTGLA
jgi:hypothetical protein